jgi:hypothetical protein
MEKSELSSLISLVDEFVKLLKKELLSVEAPMSRGIWDKMKNWWYNLTKKNDPKNPYFYKNKFGALGHPEETDLAIESKRLSLEEYKFIRDCYEDLESSLEVLSEETVNDSENIKNLKLFKIIDSWANRFKKAIIGKFIVPTKSEQPKESPQPEIKTKEEPKLKTTNISAGSGPGGRVDVGTKSDFNTRTDVSAGSEFGSRFDTIRSKPELKSMEEIPAKKPETKPAKEEKEEEHLGSGRAGSGLSIQWREDRFVVIKSVDGKKRRVDVNAENIKPISELEKKTKEQIEKESYAAENSLKFEVYDRITTSPHGGRKAKGVRPGERLFAIDVSKFDEEFKKVFTSVLEKVSEDYKGKNIKTQGKELHKKISNLVYEKIDDIFHERRIPGMDDTDMDFEYTPDTV